LRYLSLCLNCRRAASAIKIPPVCPHRFILRFAIPRIITYFTPRIIRSISSRSVVVRSRETNNDIKDLPQRERKDERGKKGVGENYQGMEIIMENTRYAESNFAESRRTSTRIIDVDSLSRSDNGTFIARTRSDRCPKTSRPPRSSRLSVNLSRIAAGSSAAQERRYATRVHFFFSFFLRNCNETTRPSSRG